MSTIASNGKIEYVVGGDIERAKCVMRMVGALDHTAAKFPEDYAHLDNATAEAYKLLGHDAASDELLKGYDAVLLMK